ncbi:hypothetical protein C0J52_10931 [Blattella germanica]|nr:hypothetical protein C0J52_10931 [Blattella germanica]
MEGSDYSDRSHKTYNECDIVIAKIDERTTKKRWCGFRMRPRFELGRCHVSWCWTVFLIVHMVILCCPVSSFGMPVPERPDRESGGRHRRNIIGDNVVSISPIML